MNITALSIDLQNDFCDPKGSLFVPGADKDVERVAKFIRNNKKRIENYRLTYDSHQCLHIAHTICWADHKNQHPAPFTTIELSDVLGKNPKYKAYNPAWQKRYVDYIEQLDKNGRYKCTLWPRHCVIGTWGWGLHPLVSDALIDWCETEFSIQDITVKGANIFTENYSAVKADVPDPSDPTTQLNTDLIQRLQESDTIILYGQALNFCLANTVRDIADEFGDEHVKKLVLFEDCTSAIQDQPGSTVLAEMTDNFLRDLKKRGMQVIKSTDF